MGNAASNKARYQRRRDAGQCVRCGADSSGALLCQRHWEKMEPKKALAYVLANAAPPRPKTLVPVLSSWEITPSRRGPWGDSKVVRL